MKWGDLREMLAISFAAAVTALRSWLATSLLDWSCIVDTAGQSWIVQTSCCPACWHRAAISFSAAPRGAYIKEETQTMLQDGLFKMQRVTRELHLEESPVLRNGDVIPNLGWSCLLLNSLARDWIQHEKSECGLQVKKSSVFLWGNNLAL